MRTRRVLSILPAAALAATLAACGSSSSGGTPSPAGSSPSGASGSLTVGAAGFTESNVLAQMYADLLENAGFDVNVKQVSSSEIFQSSLESGKIAVVPEYAATYANSLQTLQTGTQTPDAADPSLDVTMTNLDKWASKRGIEALDPSKAVDQNAFAVTKDFATAHHLTTLSDLGASGLSIKLGAPTECADRPFCQPGLEHTYGITISGLAPYDFDSLAVKQAVKTGKVDMGEVSTTDATLDQLGLVTLTDDKHLQNADNLVPIANSEQLQAHPEIATALNPLAAVLTTADLGDLNNQIDGERKTVEEVATAYLTDKGLNLTKMAQLGPWMITARNKEHAEYLIRSRAEQRGLHVESVDASGGDGDMWSVSVVVTESEDAGKAAQLGDDTQVFHLDTHKHD